MPKDNAPPLSDWTRIALEGATTDGRELTRQQIQDMADTYDPKKYGARINLEHFHGVLPDGPFKSYGDVVKVKAQEDTLDGQKRLGLYAILSPTDDLIAINQQRQKVFTSIEMYPDFAKSGRAYLAGLAVTDNPASLGTQMLKFCTEHPEASPLAARKTDPSTLFSEAVATELRFTQPTENLLDGVLQRFSEFFKMAPPQPAVTPPPAPAEAHIQQGFKQLAEGLLEPLQALTQRLESLEKAQATQSARLDQYIATPDPTQAQRPLVTGGAASNLTDC